MHGPIHQPLQVHRCTFTWTLSKTRACAFPQTAWERWMDNTWKSLLDDGLDAGLMNNWLFTYQYFLLFSWQDWRIKELKKNCYQSAVRPILPITSAESLRPARTFLRVDFPGEVIPMHTTDAEWFYHVLQTTFMMQPKGHLLRGDRKLHF